MKLALISATFLFPLLALAQGGPPMVTDDPGTPGDGHWEINVASITQFVQGQNLIQVPYVDANYGWGDHIQLKLETGWSFLAGDSENPGLNGMGNGLAGVKWRFLDEEKSFASVSTYPQFEFRFPFSSSNDELTDPGNALLLPLELTKTFGSFELNPEIGYVFATRIPDQWWVGLVVAYEAKKNLELLFEARNESLVNRAGNALFLSSGSGNQFLLNVGERWGLTEHLLLIGALGRTLANFQGEPNLTLVYLGFQILI